MAEGTKSTILIAIISAISAIIVAMITTYGTIAVSEPAAKKVKKELEEISDLQQIANLPIGTIVPSMLHPSLFAKVVGDPSVFDPEKSKWVLADKQKDITRSRYSKLLNNTRYTPDLRGMFLRGMNEGRNDGDPDKNRKAGDEQNGMLENHRHNIANVVYDAGGKPEEAKNIPYGTRHYWFGYQNPPPTDFYGGDETRPKNVAVYFYIKIN